MYQIQKGLIIQKLDKETVIFDAEKSVLYTLNETAAEIFKMIKKGLEEDKIIEKIVKKYEVKKEKVEKDIKKLLEELKKKKIIL
jgi:hypothetical protein